MNTPTGRPLALVTGASSGIGRELARQFAERGYDLIIAAEDGGIAEAAHEIESIDGAHAEPVQADLAKQDGAQAARSPVAPTSPTSSRSWT
jgi:NAD(P)-dependent dehydrogenase (short-subunit alcohol dehydrogenase family)